MQGADQPNGYTEAVLHKWRRAAKPSSHARRETGELGGVDQVDDLADLVGILVTVPGQDRGQFRARTGRVVAGQVAEQGVVRGSGGAAGAQFGAEGGQSAGGGCTHEYQCRRRASMRPMTQSTAHPCASVIVVDVAALRWFQQVADGTTVTEVSQIEGVTQSGVSRALARLEAEIGTPLLRRSGRTLRLTRAARPSSGTSTGCCTSSTTGLRRLPHCLRRTAGRSRSPSNSRWVPGSCRDSSRASRSAIRRLRFELHQIRDETNEPRLSAGHGGSRDHHCAVDRPGHPLATAAQRTAVPRRAREHTRYAAAVE